MPVTGTTHICLVLDRSGSMQAVHADALGSVNTYITTAKRDRALYEARFSMITFNSESVDTIRQNEAREVSASVSRSIHQELSQLALVATTEPAPKTAAILNAAYLVSRDAPEPFQARLTDLIHKFEPLGFRFEFTGPWPPYHFVGR